MDTNARNLWQPSEWAVPYDYDPEPTPVGDKRQQAVIWLENMFGNTTRPRGFTNGMSDRALFAEMAYCRLEWMVDPSGHGHWFDHASAFQARYEEWYRKWSFDLDPDEGAGPAPVEESWAEWARRESFDNLSYLAPNNDYFWWLERESAL